MPLPRQTLLSIPLRTTPSRNTQPAHPPPYRKTTPLLSPLPSLPPPHPLPVPALHLSAHPQRSKLSALSSRSQARAGYILASASTSSGIVWGRPSTLPSTTYSVSCSGERRAGIVKGKEGREKGSKEICRIGRRDGCLRGWYRSYVEVWRV
jgi:hypothetical protein